MQEQGRSRADVCRDLNLKYTTFTEWVTGRKYPRIDKLDALSKYFGVPLSTLVCAPEDAPPNKVQTLIPILGRISAGQPLYCEQNIEGYVCCDHKCGEYFALRVHGDSMTAARISDGDVLVVRRQDTVEDGEIAVVLVGDEEATVKQFFRVNNVVTLVPKSLNPEHKIQVYDLKTTPVRVLGRVVENKIFF